MVEHFTNWMDLTILGLLLHYLISIRPHAGKFEQNRMVQTIQNFDLFDTKKKKKKKKS